MGGGTLIGPWANLVSADFDEPPSIEADAEALLLYVPEAQAGGLSLPPIATTAPDSQPSALDRLAALIWKVRAGAELSPACIVGIADASAPLQDAVDAAGASGIDLDAVPLILAPLWPFTPAERASLRLRMLPP